MNKVILPLGEPLVQAFNEYGYLFSIIRSKDSLNYKKLIVQYFTNLFCVPEEYSEYKHILSFYPDRHERLLRTCPLLESKLYSRSEVINQQEKLINKIKKYIDMGYYVTVYVDLYYISCSESYQKRHINHNIMLYGYQEQEKVLFVIDTFRSFKFEASQILYAEFEQAFYNYEQAENKRDNKILVIKFQEQEINLDTDKLKEELQKFYLIDENIPYISGCHVYDLLEKGIDSKCYLHPQSIKVLCEHINFTVIRAKLLEELNVIHINEYLRKQLNELLIKSKHISNLYLKCIVLNEKGVNKEFRTQVINQMNWIKEIHVEVIQKVVKEMAEKNPG